MPKFPSKETDVVALADQMIVGLGNHGSEFPSINAGRLNEVVDTFKNYRGQQEDAKSQAKIATATKEQVYSDMVELMKNDLKLAEVDAAAAPQKLSLIGWGPRSQPVAINPPMNPSNLKVEAESIGEIWLKWDKPAWDPNRPVRNYLVERCEKKDESGYTPWELLETTYNCEIHLIEQPSNRRMLYRIKSANAAGISLPSNTILVVLP